MRWLLAVLLVAPDISRAGAVMQGTQPWPNATVAYHFAPELLKAVGTTHKDCTGWNTWRTGTAAFKACNAMNAWQTATGVRFVADTRLDALQIVPANSTDATLGHLPIGNRLRIQPGATYGAVLHEFGHVLGLMHEHQRPDRDDYLILEPFLQNDLATCGFKIDAVCRDVSNAFPKVRVLLSSDYDPCSLMHYLADQTPRHREDPRWGRIFTLSGRGKAALTACLPQFARLEPRCRKVGQKCAISAEDAVTVRRFYKLDRSGTF